MDIRSLRYFLAVGRLQNITKAAEFLHISQPSLSVQIQQLEAELGKTLLKREKRHISLTPDGELLCRRAEEILSLVEKTKGELQNTEEHIGGDITIASGDVAAMNLVIQAAGHFRQAYPRVTWHCFSGDATAISEKMTHGIIDFGIFLDPIDVAKYGHISLPVTMTWGVLMKSSSPLASHSRISAAEMEGVPLVVPQRLELQQQIAQWLQQDIRQLPIAATYNISQLVGSLVEADMGCAVILDALVEMTKYKNLCFRPFVPEQTARLSLVWEKYRPLSRQSQVFIEFLRHYLEMPKRTFDRDN